MDFNYIETKKNIPRNAEHILDESTSIICAEKNPIETCLSIPNINPPKLFQAKETLSTHSFTNASETSTETIEAAEQQENTLFKQEIVSKCVKNPVIFHLQQIKFTSNIDPNYIYIIKEEPIETPDFYLFNVHSERIKSDSDNNLYEIVSLNPPDQFYAELTNQQTPNHTVNSNNESNTQNENSNTQQTPNHTVNSNKGSNTQNENSNTQQTPNHTVNSNNESNTQNENSNTQETSVPSLDDHDAFIKWIEEYNFNKSPDPSKITEI
ncbi:hypothetical protein LUQ84_000054 [Hamiltosporidium tvaerminnensis]|nr:hypothetical protein LUQ84_000054 [Hamiltosporidium tvaerminnensis]